MTDLDPTLVAAFRASMLRDGWNPAEIDDLLSMTTSISPGGDTDELVVQMPARQR